MMAVLRTSRGMVTPVGSVTDTIDLVEKFHLQVLDVIIIAETVLTLTVLDSVFPVECGNCVVMSPGAWCLQVVI
jgi:hypothetical protein